MFTTGRIARIVALAGVAAAIWGVALPASSVSVTAGASINRATVVSGASINGASINGASTNGASIN